MTIAVCRWMRLGHYRPTSPNCGGLRLIAILGFSSTQAETPKRLNENTLKNLNFGERSTMKMISKIIPARIPLRLTPQEKMFLLLVAVVGVTGGEAYRLAFKTDANNVSATVMASKLLRGEKMQDAIRVLYRYYKDGRYAFNERLLRY